MGLRIGAVGRELFRIVRQKVHIRTCGNRRYPDLIIGNSYR
jgi:hypothetical protein